MLEGRGRALRLSAFVAAVFVGLPVCLISDTARSKPKRIAARPAPAISPSPQKAAEMLGGLPLVFEPNFGQTDPQVRFLTRASGMISFLTDRENVMVLSRRKDKPDLRDPHKIPEIEQTVVRMKLEGARSPRRFEGLEKTESISNYFVGNDRSKWRPNVPNYRKVRARAVYNGIDVVYYGDGRKLEYDFVVQPGADPSQIRLAYDGADSLTTDAQGNLLLATSVGTLVQQKPKVYQEFAGHRREIEAAYEIRDGHVEMAMGNWDHQRELVIDPVLVYSTYLGGSGGDAAYGIAVNNGLVYVTGYTFSSDFPLKNSLPGIPTLPNPLDNQASRVFVTALNPAIPLAGGLVYSTYLGGSGRDTSAAIAVDAGGEAYVTGSTTSTDFPLENPLTTGGPPPPGPTSVRRAFVTKLSAIGNSLIFSTYLGGNGTDQATGIAVDAGGAAYVTGYTTSTDFPTTANAYQPAIQSTRATFVAKLASVSGSTSLAYSTYLGGSNGGNEGGRAIAVDALSLVYVTGSAATGFPVTPGAFQEIPLGSSQAFMAKLNPAVSGVTSLLYSTYLGGTGFEAGNGIAVDTHGMVYVAGIADAVDFPTTPGAFQRTYGGGSGDAFVAKLNPAGAGNSDLVYSTYLGTSAYDNANAVAVDDSGAVYLTGYTNSPTNFPTSLCALQPAAIEYPVAFVTKLNPAGGGSSDLVYSTYLGGNRQSYGQGIAVDASEAAYVTGYTYSTTDFPITADAYQSTNAGVGVAYVTKLNLTSPIAANITAAATSSPQSTAVGTQFSTPLAARVTDSAGDPVGGISVTFTAPGSGASAAFSGNGTTGSSVTVTTDCDGMASVTATANVVLGTYPVMASVANGTSTLTATFTLTNFAGAAAMISFTGQPTNTTAGSAIAPPVVVLLVDTVGNPISGVQIFISVQNGAASLGGTLTATTDSTGHATFNNLVIKTAGTYTLQASASNGVTGLSNSFTISAGTAVSIAVSAGNNQTAFVGEAFAAPLQAIVYDAEQNPVPGASVTFTAPASGPSGAFAGSLTSTVTTNASGIATSTVLTADSQPGAFQVTAITAGPAQGGTFTLTNVADTANKLVFIQQPTNTTAGAVMSSVTVQLEDSSGTAVHTSGISITLQLLPAQTLSGTVPRTTDTNGQAIFNDLSVQRAGQYQLLATAASTVSASSQTFNVTAGAAAMIQATGGAQQSAIINTVFGAPLQATVTDGAGNPVSGVEVVFTAPTPGASGLFSGQPTVTVMTDQNGHASAAITANGIAGSYGVTASSTMITGSATFSLENLPVGANTLAFVQQPTNTIAGQVINPPVTVRVQSASGQPVSVQGIPIILSLSSGTGTLLGTLVQLTDPTGLATFNDLHMAQTGTKRLHATASQAVSADSNTFQITSGTASSIIAISGTPQFATVSQQFLSLLRAQVTDSAGNPVSGVTVTFAAPTSGPSGTFAGAVTVTTDSNGIATAPLLTANNLAGSFTVTATATGIASPATFALTNLPQQTSTIAVNPNDIGFTSQTGQPAPPGQTVQVAATVSWTVSSSASWLSASPASGNGTGSITVSVNPAGLAAGVYTGSIRITGSDGSVALVLVTFTVTTHPALVITPPTLLFSTSSNTVAPAAQTLTATSSSQPIAYNVSAEVSTPSGGTWLQVSSAQGQTPGSVTVNVNPAGLSQGVYDGSVLFTPTQSGVNSVAVPVTLIVGCIEGGCVMEPNIITVLNGASFQPGGAPRSIMTIFGTNLSDAVYQATSYPLPTVLGPTSVMVNGVAAPLFYASPTQINFQMPSSAPTTPVQVVVNNQAVSGSTPALRASQPHTSPLAVVDPGLFVTSDRRAAALNGDLSVHTAATPVPAGGYIILFITGAGPVTPALPDGSAAPESPLSIINDTVQVSIGGQSATVAFQGVAPGFAGLDQLNVIVPSGLTPGDQPVFVTINGASSNSGVITVK